MQVILTLQLEVRVPDEWEANQEWDITAAELRAAKIHVFFTVTKLWQSLKTNKTWENAL